ncbi:NF038129 family PEP-CTERM protein [Geobacter pelophilus]|uniref:NF038129 family PEP-CTERM protein n=1 Tax=Geoanaerobacter pelophilus TaxID=60036 RepID=A0AAW4L5B6_9BACT|nr:NF038129 family PEP-CTERM protein [Geoanaerobacter pelophilus]MBT0666168.1 NF038129 family PEP-CTERM protein [Geoanaerobacter pelophilus]
MNFLKIKLFIVSVIMFAASSAFADLSFDVSIDTSRINRTRGFLYLQYGGLNGVPSSVNVREIRFAESGFISGPPSDQVVDGSAVIGRLPSFVHFNNTNGTNDYNQGYWFKNLLKFNISFPGPPVGTPDGGSSTFSLCIFRDEIGLQPLFNADGINGSVAGSLFNINLMNDGSTSTEIFASEASVTPTPAPIPTAAWLLGSGLMGLVGIRRRRK